MNKKLSEMSLEELWELFPINLVKHNEIWKEWFNLEEKYLRDNIKNVLRISHIGSTYIDSIYAKPIIDIVIGVNTLDSINPYIELLEINGIIFRKEDVKGQLLFVIGDFEKEFRTHHIHIVEWNSIAWNNYINFRDYLNTFSKYAKEYDDLKKKLSLQFAENRENYTAGKHEFIEKILKQAYSWKLSVSSVETKKKPEMAYQLPSSTPRPRSPKE